MSRPPNDVVGTESHLSIQDLASIAEGNEASSHSVEHLSRCRSCMAAYADAVRYRAAWVACPEAFGDRGVPNGLPAPESRRSAIPLAGWAGAAAVLAVVIGLFALGPWRTLPRRGDVPPTIQRLLVHASSQGLVFPGAEAGATGERPSYRAANDFTEEARQPLETLREQIESGEISIDRWYALAAGLIATGRVDLAHDYIVEGRHRSPRDARFPVLAAMVALKRGDAAAAERLLREAHRLAPRDPTVALDLGLVVHRTQGLSAARPYLNLAIERAPGTKLAERARHLLEGSSAR